MRDADMPTDPLDRLERLFRAAQMHPPGERTAFLEAACADDHALREELISLLRADDEADEEDFLNEPVLPDSSGSKTELKDDFIGRRVGPYLIQKLLGSGGMGDVYLALQQEPFKRYVALKIMRRGMDTRQVLRRFEMERQILASLNHPNVAKLLDGGVTDNGLPYFAMEYVEGLPITQYCDAHRLNLKARLQLYKTVCNAVHYAHQNLVLHRDVKPSNILVTREGGVKLLDFGIAKFLNPGMSPLTMPVTHIDLRLMTPEYASPEQVRGEPLTTASDVYSLGVILYELLTGHRPYHLRRRTSVEIAEVVCEQDPERPSSKIASTETVTGSDGETTEVTPAVVSEARSMTLDRLRRDLRGDLDNIVLKVLCKETAGRYNSAEHLSQEIERFLEGHPVQAQGYGRAYRMRKFVRRHRAEAVAALLVLISLLTGLGVALWQSVEARQDRDIAQRALSKSEVVTSFLMGLFEANDPNTMPGQEVTARALLERGMKRAEELEGQPEVQAELLGVIGRVYTLLGYYQEARPLLERALSMRRSSGEENEALARSLYDMGLLMRYQGDHEAALVHFEEAITLQKTLLGENHPDVLETMSELGRLYSTTRDLERAEPLLREVLQKRVEVLGADHLDVSESQTYLAAVLRMKGDYKAAEPLYRDALAIRRKQLGDEHTLIASSLNNLGLQLRQMGRYDEALTLLREALDMQRRLRGEAHPELATMINNVARTLVLKGEYDEAERLHREALEIQERFMGKESTEVAGTIDNLAALLRRKGDFSTAEPLYREALAMRRKILGESSPVVAVSLNNLALLLQETDRYEEAESLYRRAIEIQRSWLDAPTPNLATFTANLARTMREKGAYDDAEQLLTEALEMQRELLGDKNPSVATSLNDMAILLHRQGSLVQAESLFYEVLSMRRELLGDDHPQVVQSLQDLASLLVDKRDYRSAETQLMEALDIYERTYGASYQPLQEVYAQCVDLYEAWGRPTDAARYRARLNP